MPFDQKRFERSVSQTRDIFDKFVYRPDNSDEITDMQNPGYFSESRFATDPDWVGSLIEIEIPTGYYIGKILSNGAVTVLFDSTKAGGSSPTEVLAGFSTNTQAPPGLDTPIRVEYGPAQGTGSDPLQIDATGLITVNETGAYNFRTLLAVERPGSTGEAYVFLRVLVNSVQAGNAIAIVLDDDELTLPLQYDFFINLSAGDTIETEFYRDSQGTPSANEGSLVSYTSSIGWGNTPSATLRVTKF